MSRTATISANDFRPTAGGEPWDAELYWGMFLWELGLLEREPKRQFVPHNPRDPYQGERDDFNEHRWGLYDRDWEKLQAIRSVQVVPVEEPEYSRRGTSVLCRGVFQPESYQRIVDDLLEVPGTHRVVVRLADVAEAVVEALLGSDGLDPKALALRTRTQPSSLPTNIVQDAANLILALPHNDMVRFNIEVTKLTNDMVAKLEQVTGRKALDGLREMLRASMPKPWNNDPGSKISRKYARELAASFRANSKPIK